MKADFIALADVNAHHIVADVIVLADVIVNISCIIFIYGRCYCQGLCIYPFIYNWQMLLPDICGRC